MERRGGGGGVDGGGDGGGFERENLAGAREGLLGFE